MTPVFDKDQKILGYLEEVPYPVGRSFRLYARPQISFRDAVKFDPDEPFTVEECGFEWGYLGAERSRGDRYECPILIATNPDCLKDIRGFKFFAEVHSTRLETRRYG